MQKFYSCNLYFWNSTSVVTCESIQLISAKDIVRMQSDAMRQQIDQSISGAEGMANNITKSAIVDFSAVLPSLEEQQKIASTIKVETHKFLLLIEKATKQLNLLDERKSSLISAAVTGKIDVRNWQPRT